LYSSPDNNLNLKVTIKDTITLKVIPSFKLLTTGEYKVMQIYKNKILLSFIDQTNIFTLSKTFLIDDYDIYVNLNIIGKHSVNIVGYDDNKNRILIKNSWGNLWGNNGYASMSYDFLLKGIGNNMFWHGLYTIE
jgi:C1A family cysteine protease